MLFKEILAIWSWRLFQRPCESPQRKNKTATIKQYFMESSTLVLSILFGRLIRKKSKRILGSVLELLANDLGARVVLSGSTPE
jgi:hypothetical protein